MDEDAQRGSRSEVGCSSWVPGGEHHPGADAPRSRCLDWKLSGVVLGTQSPPPWSRHVQGVVSVPPWCEFGVAANPSTGDGLARLAAACAVACSRNVLACRHKCMPHAESFVGAC